MALPFAVSVLLIGLSCALFAKPTPRASKGGLRRAAPARDPDVAPVDRRRAIAFGALLLVVIASVFRLVPYPVSLVAVVAGLFVLDRRALRSVDFRAAAHLRLLLRVRGQYGAHPSVEAVLSRAMADNALLASAAASQIVSNVPVSGVAVAFHRQLSGAARGREHRRRGHAGGIAGQPSSRSTSIVPCVLRSGAVLNWRAKRRAALSRASRLSISCGSRGAVCCVRRMRIAAHRSSAHKPHGPPKRPLGGPSRSTNPSLGA